VLTAAGLVAIGPSQQPRVAVAELQPHGVECIPAFVGIAGHRHLDLSQQAWGVRVGEVHGRHPQHDLAAVVPAAPDRRERDHRQVALDRGQLRARGIECRDLLDGGRRGDIEDVEVRALGGDTDSVRAEGERLAGGGIGFPSAGPRAAEKRPGRLAEVDGRDHERVLARDVGHHG